LSQRESISNQGQSRCRASSSSTTIASSCGPAGMTSFSILCRVAAGIAGTARSDRGRHAPEIYRKASGRISACKAVRESMPAIRQPPRAAVPAQIFVSVSQCNSGRAPTPVILTCLADNTIFHSRAFNVRVRRPAGSGSSRLRLADVSAVPADPSLEKKTGGVVAFRGRPRSSAYPDISTLAALKPSQPSW
jgi:hypothetical protein